MTTRLLKIADIAALTGLSPSTIRRLIADGRLPAVRPTQRSLRVPEAAVQALMTVGVNGGDAEKISGQAD